MKTILTSLIGTLLLLGLIPDAGHAQESSPSAVTHKSIARLLSDETSIVAWCDLTKTDLPATVEFLSSLRGRGMGRALGQLAPLKRALEQLDVKKVYWIGDFSTLLSSPQLVIVPTKNPDAVSLLIKSALQDESIVSRHLDSVVIVGKRAVVNSMKAASSEETELKVDLDAAMKACSGSFGIAIAPRSYVLPTLSRSMGVSADGHPEIAAVVESLNGIRWIAAYGDLPPSRNALRVRLASSAAAKEFADALNILSKKGLGEKSKALEFSVSGEVAEIETDSPNDVTQIIAALAGANPGVSSMSRANDMKQIALALHNYYASHQQFPPQSLAGEDGKRLLSWRVLILPYLEQQELYEKFRLDEPWDSPHNLQLAKQIPPTYQLPSERGENGEASLTTNILAPLTASSAFGKQGGALQFPMITDGTSNTIWFVEAAERHAVVWTKPEDLNVNIESPIASIVDAEAKGFLAARIDGSVRFVELTELSDKKLNALLTIDGGEVDE